MGITSAKRNVHHVAFEIVFWSLGIFIKFLWWLELLINVKEVKDYTGQKWSWDIATRESS